MKKTFLIIAFLSVLLLTVSGFNDQRIGVMPGKIAPVLTLEKENQSVDLSDYRGRYVILSFWTSSDANSRMLCNGYDAWVKKNDPLSEKVCMVGVNLDENSSLFNQIVKADNLNEGMQFNVKGKKAAKINSDYHLSAGCGTLLIDPEGRIVAANPSPALLTEHVQANV